MKTLPAEFESLTIRRVYDEATETWSFSVIDIIQVLTQQPDYQGARKYWKVLKGRLAKEGSQLVSSCYQLKLAAADGKQRLTDVATAQTLLRLVQSVPSPKANQAVAGEGGLRAHTGNRRSGPVAEPSARDLAETRAQREVDRPAHDRAGNAQQADGLLGESRHQAGRRIRHSHQPDPSGMGGRERESAQGDEGFARP